ncbi:cupin domain-containing protein [Kozakia baliensis]|uniref:Uncharacterized protein n=1 Tax=Kozakia baliensis TaxID=153496 RepID=A0A1D8UV75_9PROT|nr:hypothetical protein [Kozakia baliensis]AOX17542.1 hypothetical protein A0U89_10750 [Kozakia baliensis]GBR30911.1 hypothetical protein AA0488_2130 [Kozakia baliensis NRIC 0488]
MSNGRGRAADFSERRHGAASCRDRAAHYVGKIILASQGHDMEAGGFVHLPVGMPHALKTESDSIVMQISGTGPLGMEYVNASDDPRRQK